MDMGISGRVALVTGAGRGIGLEIGRTLAEEGARVAVNDLFAERAEEGAEEIRATGGQALGVAGDVMDTDSVSAMVARVMDEFGAIDILVNNAGIPAVTSRDAVPATGGFFAGSDREQWERTMGLITYGVLNCSRAVIEQMTERRWGRIVNIISDAGRVGEPRLVAYSMAKAGVVGFSKALAKESGRFCVTVNCVSPATTETDATAAWIQAQGEQIMRQYPLAKGLGRLGRPSDIANAVAFLASQRAEWITGQVLSVNGGYSMAD
ncbi:MAG TPA: glucose 1-dehydrogenase [Dehalococcoidia bacterium]|jgi:NAD(P)-dependent dehydrogenase (short-subunit alcohol dehydrogenase family)|nr:glucose 1-dehydrogenase [Dehalococcoidia bacterium]